MQTTETSRERKEKLRSQLRMERESFVSRWRDLNDYLLPSRGRFLTSDANRGDKRPSKIINDTGTNASRMLRSGMMSGITSPARPWHRLTTPDPKMAERGSAKEWLHHVTDGQRSVFLRSNLYNALPTFYHDMGVFGTAAMWTEEDDRDVLRFYPLAIGSYMLAASERLKVDTIVREFRMTVRQIVQMFGDPKADSDEKKWRNISQSVKNLWDNGQYEQWVDVVHLVQPNPDYNPKRLGSKHKAFYSCYYELSEDRPDTFLRESGYDEFPVLAARWDVTGEDVYGTSCPGMQCLGDVKALQKLEKTGLLLTDKIADPAMTAPESLRGKASSLLPGHTTYLDVNDPRAGFRPIHEINPAAVTVVDEKIMKHEARINRAFYADLWLLIALSDRSNVTAAEINAKEQEKLLQLGPVLERLNDELLSPLIDRTFNVMYRRGMLPQPPQELQKVDLKVEYLSIMAQAQKLVSVSAVDRFVGYVSNLAAAQVAVGLPPTAFDKLDVEQSVDEYADITGVPPQLVREDETVAAMQEQRAQAQAQQQQVAMMQQAAKGAKDLAGADMSGDNALTALMGTGQ